MTHAYDCPRTQAWDHGEWQAPCTCEPPSSQLDHERSGEQNADERTYHGVTCSLAEYDDSDDDDDYRQWWVRCRDEKRDEEILVEQHRRTLKLVPYGSPKRFHRVAMAFVKEEPEFDGGEY